MTIDPAIIRLIAFDVMNTVADISSVPREELRAYVDCFSAPTYSRHHPPESWKSLPMYADAAEGIHRLQAKYEVAALSNVPAATLMPMLRNAGLGYMPVVPIELLRVYKPNERAYLAACQMFAVRPSKVLIVTANPKLGKHDYGDVEAAQKLGMQAVLIRQPGCPQTITELADLLGC